MELRLIDGPYAVDGESVRAIPAGSERLVVHVALLGPVQRRAAAQLLWPEATAHRAAGNLRSALWRLHAAGLALVEERDGRLMLGDGVVVDAAGLCERAAALAARVAGPGDLDLLPQLVAALNLLPGWYDDWVAAERERIRALMLDGLDALSTQLNRAGRRAEAIDAALVAVTSDPLRETSQAALVTAHLDEGNLNEARRAYEAYRELLASDMGLEPPAYLARLLGPGPA